MSSPIITSVTGLWLMISPTVFNMDVATSNNNYIIGPLVLTFSVISFWQINRNVIKANIVLGVWLLIALFIFNFTYALAFLSNGISGVLLILLSSVKRKTTEKFGGGWRSLFQDDPVHLREAEKLSQTGKK